MERAFIRLKSNPEADVCRRPWGEAPYLIEYRKAFHRISRSSVTFLGLWRDSSGGLRFESFGPTIEFVASKIPLPNYFLS